MARVNTPQRIRTRGFAWGQRRVDLGLSMRELAKLTGVSKAVLSQVESGRMIPTGEEFIKVTTALEAVSREAAGSDPGPVSTPAASPN